MGRIRLLTLLAVVAAVAAACAPALRGGTASGLSPASPVFEKPLPPLDVAMQQAADSGPVRADQVLHFEINLRDRDAAGLQAVLAQGGRVTPAQFAARFGPNPSAVARLAALLRQAGITVAPRPGDTIINAHAAASAIERFFSVRIDNFHPAGGAGFYAATSRAVIPARLGGVVASVTGLDDYQRGIVAALPAADSVGVTPQDMISFYDGGRLTAANDGTGMTVVFLEWAVPDNAVLQAYAQKFTAGRPITIALHTDPADWGAPFPPGDPQYENTAMEASLDIEIVHGIAPRAREVVYALSRATALPVVLQTVAQQFPNAIISSSIAAHACGYEQGAGDDAQAEDSAESKIASTASIFWATGDYGAHGCIADYPDRDPNAQTELSMWPDTTPDVTAVGATQVFFSANGGYFQEAAWGEPLNQDGSGGGKNPIFGRPAWQQAPGVPADLNVRGVPDVVANGDSSSLWDIFRPDPSDPSLPQETGIFGTSAAAPFWAGFTADIDEDLVHKGLPAIGLANKALYAFAQNPSGLPAPAFHDVTLGNDLGYDAGPGWDYATGLGSPDIGALADDFEWYERTQARHA